LINLFDDLAKWGREYPVIADKLAFWGPLIAAAGILLWPFCRRFSEWLQNIMRPWKGPVAAIREPSALPSPQVLQNVFTEAIDRGKKEGMRPFPSPPRILFAVIKPPDSAHEHERPIVSKTPDELRAKLRNMTSVAAARIAVDYIDKWTALDSVVSNVDADADGITITFEHSGPGAVFGHFNTKYRAHLTHLESGDRLRFFGRIDSLEQYTVWYRDCEPVSD